MWRIQKSELGRAKQFWTAKIFMVPLFKQISQGKRQYRQAIQPKAVCSTTNFGGANYYLGQPSAEVYVIRDLLR